MKKRITTTLVVMSIGFSLIGCGANADNESSVTEQTTKAAVTTEVETTTEAETNAKAQNATEAETATEAEATTEADNNTEESSSQGASIEGTWMSGSMTGENENYPAEKYVQFTDSEINYGHMSDDGNFEVEYSDTITSFKEISEGIYRVQAESKDGSQYTYQTNEHDNTVLDYYGTWNEDEFHDNYSGSSSLFKSFF